MRAFIQIVSAALLLVSVASGEVRTWKSANGHKTEAEFLSRDEAAIKLKKANGTIVNVPIDKLHPDEQKYISETHPLLSDAPNEVNLAPGNAYGPLSFGDSFEEVKAKLFAWPLVKTKMKNNLIGRTGLNLSLIHI